MPKIRPLGTNEDLSKAKRFYTPRELAELLSVTESFLNKLRIKGGGPQYIKLGYRVLRYRAEDVEQYIENLKRTSTSA